MRTLLLVFAGTFGGFLVSADLAQAALPKTHPYVRYPHVQTRVAPTEWAIPTLCKAYNFPTKAAGGGTIGILEFGGGWQQSDLNAFSKLNSMPTISVTNVSIDGTQNNPGKDYDSDAEVALDIQCSAAAYYYATGTMPKIIVFFSNGDYVNTFSAAVANKCDVLSISWGDDEKSWQAEAPGYAQQVEAAATTATAAGLAIFAASGDNSSSDDDSGTNVDLPASCPHVVGCGGTSKTTSTEVVWGDGKSTAEGTGGGYSAIFPVQSFQIGAPTAPKGLGRMVPDVAADADPNTGMIIVLDGEVILIGGTSAVAPLYSGLFAALGKQPGYVTPTLWKNPKAFVDITSGSNGAYSAAVGPDACSGLGVPNGTSVLALFGSSTTSSPPPPPPPASNIVAVNYNTSSKTLTLTGDTNANTITIIRSGASVLVLETSGGTKLTLSTNSGAAGSATTSASILSFSGNLTIAGNMSDGNDSVTLNGLPISTVTLELGNGNDTASMILCTVGTSAIDGGAGVNVFAEFATSIKINRNTNFP